MEPTILLIHLPEDGEGPVTGAWMTLKPTLGSHHPTWMMASPKLHRWSPFYQLPPAYILYHPQDSHGHLQLGYICILWRMAGVTGDGPIIFMLCDTVPGETWTNVYSCQIGNSRQTKVQILPKSNFGELWVLLGLCTEIWVKDCF